MKRFKQMKSAGIIWGAAAFVIPVLIFLCVLYRGGFYPFGDKTMLIMDMKTQYIEFYASLRDALFGDNSLFFSWSRSMGGNYWGLLAYYLSSPLSFITLFFPIENLPVAIEILTLIKLGLCGVSFFLFATNLAKKSTGFLSDGNRRRILLLILSLCYVFMSYNMVYSLSLMWLDGVILLPLILMGVEKIIEGKKGGFYLFTLAMLLISNYYTGYMVGIYTGMYMVFRVLTSVTKATWKEWLKKTVRFALLSLLAIGIASPVIIGVLKDYMQGKLAGVGEGYSIDLSLTNFSLGDLLGKYANSKYDSITDTGLPSIYCGYAALLLVIVYFLLRRIKLREKIGMFIVMGILCISFYFTSFDIAWHGFQSPNWFPYRYAFLFSFSLLYMACRALTALPQWKMTNEKWNKPVGVVCAVLLAAFVVVDMETNAESMLAGLDNQFCYDTVSEYDDIINKTKPLVDEIKTADTDFYRINQGYYEYSKNDSMLFGYNGMSHYSSTYNAAVNSLTSSLGISQGYFFNSGYGSNALLDSLFAVKYILQDKTVPKSYIKYSDSEKGASLYENPLMLSIAYGSTPSTLSPELGYGPFANQNNYISAITGENVTCFTDYACNTVRDGNEWSYDFTADSDNPVYLYMKASGTSSADVYVNDSFVGNYFTNETNGTLFLGNFENGQQVNVHVVAYADENVDLSYSEIAELHMDVLEPVLQGLQKNGMQIENHKNGTLSGKITLEEGQTIMTSIPYDEGWTVWIDGKKAETMMFADTFMAIKCPAGEHEIRFTYVSPGVMTGVWICILSLGIAALYFGFERLCHVLKSCRS